jgi:hypothetical protein
MTLRSSTRLLWLTALTLPFTVLAQQGMKVMEDNVPVRASPSDTAALVGSSPRYHTYVSTEVQNGWHKVYFTDKQAWIHGSKLAADPRGLATISASVGNVRTGPDTSFRLAGTMPSGSKWMVIGVAGTGGEWKQFYYGGAMRYMHQSLLETYDQPQSSAGFVQVPPSGEGFYTITSSDRVWGLPRLVYPLMDASRQFTRDNPGWGKIGVNDLSFKAGGYMSPHGSHQKGDDADIRLLRNDGALLTTDIYQTTYSRERTRTYITNYLAKFLNLNVILFGDRFVYGRLTSTRTDECTKAPVSTALQYVACYPSHWHHLHVRVN